MCTGERAIERHHYRAALPSHDYRAEGRENPRDSWQVQSGSDLVSRSWSQVRRGDTSRTSQWRWQVLQVHAAATPGACTYHYNCNELRIKMSWTLTIFKYRLLQLNVECDVWMQVASSYMAEVHIFKDFHRYVIGKAGANIRKVCVILVVWTAKVVSLTVVENICEFRINF